MNKRQKKKRSQAVIYKQRERTRIANRDAKKGRSLQELEHIRNLVSTANKRLRRLEQAGLDSPAYKKIERLALTEFDIQDAIEKGTYKAKPKSRIFDLTKHAQIKFRTDIPKDYNEQTRLLAEVEKFLKLQTSTVKGTKDYVKNVLSAFQEDNPDFTDYNALSLFDVAKEKAKEVQYSSDITARTIVDLSAKGLSYDEIEDFMLDKFGEPLADIEDLLDEMLEAEDWD